MVPVAWMKSPFPGKRKSPKFATAACGDSSLHLKISAFRAPRSKPSAAALLRRTRNSFIPCSLANRGRGSTLSSQTPPPHWWSQESRFWARKPSRLRRTRHATAGLDQIVNPPRRNSRASPGNNKIGHLGRRGDTRLLRVVRRAGRPSRIFFRLQIDSVSLPLRQNAKFLPIRKVHTPMAHSDLQNLWRKHQNLHLHLVNPVFSQWCGFHRDLHSFPTRRPSE